MEKVFVLELLEDNNESEVYGVFKSEETAEQAGKEMVASTENYFWEESEVKRWGYYEM